MDAFWADLKHAARMFGRKPALTISALAALALGIAANTAVFSVVNAVLLNPLSYSEPNRIVMFQNVFETGGHGGTGSPTEFNWWRQQTAFQHVSAYSLFDAANLTGDGIAERIQVMRVTSDFFTLCSTNALIGRMFIDDDDRLGAPKTAVLAYNFWQRRFGGDPRVLGKRITLNGDRYEIMGIANSTTEAAQISEMMLGNGDIEIERPPDVYVPFQLDPNSTEHGHFFNVVGRVRPGLTVAQASAQLQASYPGYAARWPEDVRGRTGFRVLPLRDAIVDNVRDSLLTLLCAVACVVLIACANVANVLLAHATEREREIAIRIALGAEPGRIVRQLLTESMMLSLGGAALGLIGGYAGIHALLSVSPGNIPRIGIDGSAVSLDWRVSTFTFALAITTGILFGLIPALKSSKAHLNTQMNAQSARAGSAPGHVQTQALLVALEISLAVVLMIGASLLLRSFLAIRQVNPGFDTHNVLTMRMSLAGSQFQDQETIARLIRDGTRRLSALPGVEVSATTDSLPLEPPGYLSFRVIDRPDGPMAQGAAIFARTSSSYFQTLRIPILRGRGFTEQDDNGLPVVLINATLAKQFWPNGDALNQRIVLYNDSPRQIVGIVGDVRASRLNRAPLPSVYLPSIRRSDITWLIRTRVTPTTLTDAIQNELRDASGGLPVAQIRTMDEVLSQSIAAEHFNALLLTIFGFSALLLAAIGIYGLMAYCVTQRSREIGVRRALGAESHQIRNMIVLQSFRLALAGVACGLLASFGLTSLLRRFLFGVQPFDPLSFALIPIVLIGVALLAASLPARRATRVDPIDVLRYE